MSSDTATRHLLIADAVPLVREGAALPPLPPLPVLDALLARMAPAGTIECTEDALETPLERALAAIHGLRGEPGRVPWAAFETGITGLPCAWIRPCHWQLGMDSAVPTDPSQLGLSEQESRALLASVAPFLAEDGIGIEYWRSDAWLAQGDIFRGLTTCSLQRACQAPLSRDALAPVGGAGHDRLRRMQSEWQMLLSDHPVNQTREDLGLWPVNALWIEGAGTLDAPPVPAGKVQVETRLAAAGTDWQQRQAAWQELDAGAAGLLQSVRGGADVYLTLCGPRRARTWRARRGPLARLLGRFMHPPQLAEIRANL